MAMIQMLFATKRLSSAHNIPVTKTGIVIAAVMSVWMLQSIEESIAASIVVMTIKILAIVTPITTKAIISKIISFSGTGGQLTGD